MIANRAERYRKGERRADDRQSGICQMWIVGEPRSSILAVSTHKDTTRYVWHLMFADSSDSTDSTHAFELLHNLCVQCQAQIHRTNHLESAHQADSPRCLSPGRCRYSAFYFVIDVATLESSNSVGAAKILTVRPRQVIDCRVRVLEWNAMLGR